MYSKQCNSNGFLTISWLLANSKAVPVSHGLLFSDNTELNFFFLIEWCVVVTRWLCAVASSFFSLKIKIKISLIFWTYVVWNWSLKNSTALSVRCRVGCEPCWMPGSSRGSGPTPTALFQCRWHHFRRRQASNHYSVWRWNWAVFRLGYFTS